MATVEEREQALARARARLDAQTKLVHTAPQEAPATRAEAISRMVSQGMTFGFGDEIESGVRAAGAFLNTPGDLSERSKGAGLAFDESQVNQQARLQASRRDFPGTSLTSELGGGGALGGALFTTLNRSRALSGLPLAARVPGIGAAEGAAFGAGSAQEGERLQGAGQGALFGAVGTPLALGFGTTISGLARPAIRRLGESLLGTPRDRAIREVRSALDADDLTPDEAIGLLRSLGHNATLADLGDTLARSGRAVTSQMGQSASRARRFLDERQLASQQELRQSARRATGADTFDRGIVEIINGAESRAAPIYNEVFSEVLDVTPAMQSILSRPAMRGAQRRAATILRNEGFSDDIVNDVTDVRYMDAIKRALDDDIGAAVRSGNRNQSRVLTQLKNDFVSEIDSQVPRYAEARSIFSGEQSIREAADYGTQVLVGNKRLSDIREIIGNYSESELQAARSGFLDWMSDTIANQNSRGNSLANKFESTPKFRETLNILFPSRQAVDEFIQTASAQAQFGRTRNLVTGGSPTARIQADRGTLQPGFISTALDAVTSPAGTLRSALSLIRGNTQLTPEVLDEMSSILFNPRITRGDLDRNPIMNMLDIARMNRVTAAGTAGGFVAPLNEERLSGLIGG